MEREVIVVNPKKNLALIQEHETKDGYALAKKLVQVLNSEIERYESATKAEKHVIEETGLINPHITDIAKAIISGGKQIAEMVNPPQQPGGGNKYQQNNFYNFPAKAVSQIEQMAPAEREKTLEIIDALIENEGK